MRAIFLLAVLSGLLVLPASPSFAAKVGETCDGIAAIQCDKGLWCEHPAGQCQVADGAGKCVAETMPPCIEMHAPVCACPVGDKPAVEYSNECFRKAAKAQPDHVGSCGGSK
jgi:hypothetical protein